MQDKQYSPSKNLSRSSPTKHNQSNSPSPSKVNSTSKSGKTQRKSSGLSSPPVAQSTTDAQSFRSQRSILETVEEKVDPKIIEEKNKSKLSRIINESPLYEKDANSPTLFYVEIGPTLSISNLYNLSHRLVVLRLTGTDLSKPSIPYIESLRTLFLDQCKLKSLVGFPLYPKLRYLNLSKNSLETFKGFPVCPDLEELDIRNNKVDFDIDLALAAIASVSMNIYNGEKMNEQSVRQAFSRSPLIGYSLRQGFPIFTNDNSKKGKKSRRGSKGKKSYGDDEEITNDANDFLIRNLLTNIASEGITTNSLLINNESSTITLPIKGKNIKWFLNAQPSVRHPSEWEQVPKSILLESDKRSGNKRRQILNITQLMYQHLIRCEFSLPDDTSNTRYSMYTLNVIGSEISQGKDELILPFPINPQVTGEPYEESLVSLVPMPVPCYVSWYNEDALIIQDVNSIRLTDKYIGNEITCYLQPYCRNMPEITFTHLAAKTNPVERLNPIVTNVNFPDEIVEGIEFKFDALVLPKREGNSKIVIERAVSPSANWEVISELQPFRTIYKPTLDDVGCFLRCQYLPILNDGTGPMDGKPSFFYSKSRVIPGFPTFTNQMIAGEPRTGHSLVAIATYTGGRKGDCHYKWFKSTKKFNINVNDDSRRRGISLSKIKGCEEIADENSAILDLKKNLVDFYLACEMIPIRNDDTIGEKVIAYLNTPISKGENLTPLKKVPSNDQVIAYKLIDLKIPVVWYRTNADWRESNGVATGFEKILVGPEYYPTDRDVGNFLRLVTNNGESDMIIGEVKPSVPFIYNFKLNIKGKKAEVGSVAEVPQKAISLISYDDDKSENGDEDNDDNSDEENSPKKADNTFLKGVSKAAMSEYYESLNRRRKVEIVWVRITKINQETNETIERVVDIDTPMYVFTKDDVNSQIKAVVYPLDDEGNRYPPTHSEPTAEIKAVKVRQPKMKGELKVDGILKIEFNDMPIYSLTWERTKKMKWEPIYTFTFHRFKKSKTNDESIPVYKLDIDDKKEYTMKELVYVVKKQDIDYHIQAEIVPGEVKEINDSVDPKKTILVIVPSKQFHGTLKSSLNTSSNVISNTDGDKSLSKTFAMMERVVPKDLHISIKNDVFDEPITEGRKITITVDGVDSSGKKPEIIWEYKTTETKKKNVYDKWVPLYKGASHVFTHDDIDLLFRVRCTNTNEIIDIGTVEPSLPTISDFTIKQDSNGSVVIHNAVYNGGVEGKSVYFYSLSSNTNNTANNTTATYSFNDDDLSYIDNSTLNIKKLKKVVKVDDKKNSENKPEVRMFTPAKEMFNKRIDIGIIPVRSDGCQGKIHWSSNSIVVKSIPIIDATMKYPNGDIDHLQVGMPLTCVVTHCTMKNCSYRYTWKRYTPISNDENGSNEDEQNNFKKEQIKTSTTPNDSSSYALKQIDDGCFIVCQIVAVAENGFVSPIFILDSYQIILQNMKDYTLSISIPSRQQVAGVRATKRASESLARSEKLDGEVDTGDILNPILTPEPKKGYSVQYEWQILSDNHESSNSKKKRNSGSKKRLSRNSSSSAFNDDIVEDNDVDNYNNDQNNWVTVSNEDSYLVSVLDLGCMIRCVCTIEGKNYSDMFESIPIGPVKINPKIEAPARAIIRSNSFKISGKAPNGNGQWDFLINSSGITYKKKNPSSSRAANNEQLVKWSNVACNIIPDELDQIEITTGPAMRIIIVPELVDQKSMASQIPKGEIRDFCIFIINQFKKKNAESNNNSGK